MKRKIKTKLIHTEIILIKERELNSCDEWIPAEWVKIRFFLTPELEVYQLETFHDTHEVGTCETTGFHTITQPVWITHNKEAVVKVFINDSFYYNLESNDNLECKLHEWSYHLRGARLSNLYINKRKVVYPAIHCNMKDVSVKAPMGFLRKLKRIRRLREKQSAR